MKLAILTPLFPPDTSVAAVYAKRLTKRLSKLHPQVVLYGKIPEKVQGATLYPVSKRSNKLKLIYGAVRQLKLINPTTLIVLNGPSSDVPALLFSFLRQTNIIYIVSDLQSHKHASSLHRYISKKLADRASGTVVLPSNTKTFLPSEELPFKTVDLKIQKKQETWWASHENKIIQYVE